MCEPDAHSPYHSGTFWKIAGAGASFQGGASAVDSATIVASLVHHLTGSVYAVGAASAVLRLGWLLPQIVVGFLAQGARRRMPFYIFGAFGRVLCLALTAILLAIAADAPPAWTGAGFLALWTVYSFVSGVVAVPYNDIVGRAIPSGARSRMLALRFFGGGILALAVAVVIRHLLVSYPTLSAYAITFAIAAALMFVSSLLFVWAGEPLAPASQTQVPAHFGAFLARGLVVLGEDRRFRLFLISQWLGGATLMALPFYVVAANGLGLPPEDVAVLLGFQTLGSLASNAAWGRIGDRLGKLRVLEVVGVLRFVPPMGVLALLIAGSPGGLIRLVAFAGVFLAIGALVNGMTIGYLGFLMEISPDDRRPAYSAYFNALASPAALLPLVGAALVHAISIEAVFAATIAAAVAQLATLRALGRDAAT